jgi:Flp pilus assembly protein TadD
VALVDAQVGRLLAALRARGREERTLVVVAGDHGESLGEHGELTHGLFVYQSTLRVPLLLRAPGLLGPRVVSEPVGLADLAPTLAALLGLPLAVEVDGRDISPSLLAGAEPATADLYAESRHPSAFGWSPLYAVRRNGFKFVDAPRPELYDLARDPSELRDVREERRREAAALATSLAALATPERNPAAAPSDAESRALLQSLGYAAPGGAPPRGGGRDPKETVALHRSYEQAQESMLSGRLDEAADRLRPLVREDPRNPAFLAAYARVLRDSHSLDEAVTVYRQAAALAPSDPQIWYELATALQRAGAPAEARRALEQTLRQDPGRPDAHNALGVLLAAEGRRAEAAESFRRAVAADPRHAQAWNNLGNALRDLRRFDEAAAAYERSAAVDPRYADPLNGRGALEVARERPLAALPWFDRALAVAADRHDVRLNRAIALDLAGRGEEAAAAYRELLELTAGDERYASEWQAAGQLLARRGARARAP